MAKIIDNLTSSSIRGLFAKPEAAASAGMLTIFAFFSLTSPLFLTRESLISVTNIVSELGIIGIGVTLLMIGGQFDLSVGSVIGLVSYFAVFLSNDCQLPIPFAFLASLLFAAGLGAINGAIVVSTGINSFIVTLGTMMIYRGVLTGVTGGFPIGVEIRGWVQSLLAGETLVGQRMSVVWLFISVLLGTWILRGTPMGNHVQAIGQNKEGARNLGIPVNRLTITLFALTSLSAGLVGLIQVARFQSVDALRGEGMELYAIAATVMGGTLLTGGHGSVVGTLIGTLTFGMIQVGLVLAGAPGFFFKTLVGAMLVGAVFVNTVVTNRFSKSGGGHS